MFLQRSTSGYGVATPSKNRAASRTRGKNDEDGALHHVTFKLLSNGNTRGSNIRYFVALAFERLRQAVVQRQVVCETLSGVLVYLRASLNGAILETLRVYSRPGAVSSPLPGARECADSNEVWDRLQARLSNRREQRLAYLLYHCGLVPGEVVRCCPREWNDIHEVAHLRRILLKRLMEGLLCEEQTFG